MKVSILVPVYGVERFIEQCATSLFGQTYDDLEFVFVDDCSPDDSVAVIERVLQRFPDRKSQTRIIRHDRNRGLGAARKTAFDASTGQFVFNVDGDDYVATDAVARLVERQAETDADVVTGAFCYLHADGTTVCHNDHCDDKERALRLMLIQNTVLPHVWARLIRRSLQTDNGIFSTEGIDMAEDYALTPRLIMSAASIACIDDVTYYYRINSSTSTFVNNLTTRHALSLLRANDTTFDYIRAHDVSGRLLFALETGMMNAHHLALASGLTTAQTAAACHYRPRGWLFRLCRALFFHDGTKGLLRLAYLTIKWFYRHWLTVGRHGRHIATHPSGKMSGELPLANHISG